jgi:hypothetical protein
MIRLLIERAIARALTKTQELLSNTLIVFSPEAGAETINQKMEQGMREYGRSLPAKCAQPGVRNVQPGHHFNNHWYP